MEKYQINENDVNDFKLVVSHATLKRKMISGLDKILKKRYEPLGRWMTKINNEGETAGGVGDISLSGNLVWSDINRLNTNYSCLKFLQNTLNELSETDQINFESSRGDVWKMLNVVIKMLNMIDEYQDIIFDESGEIYKKMISIVENSWNLGLKYTQDFTKNYKKYFPTSIDIIVEDEETGNYNDMVKGSDAYLIFNPNIKKSIQIKGAKCYLNNNEYQIFASSELKKYKNIYAFVFYDKQQHKIYIFKNDISKITPTTIKNDPVLLFPKELLYKIFEYTND